MGKNRILPFGYRISNGEIVTDTVEAMAVRKVFDEYIGGASYVEIAEFLQNMGVRYHANTPIWNRQMINRMIENRKYVGNEDYPQIITSELFDKALDIKKSKYIERRRKKVNIKLPALPAELRTPQPNMAVTRLQNEVTRALSMPLRITPLSESTTPGMHIPIWETSAFWLIREHNLARRYSRPSLTFVSKESAQIKLPSISSKPHFTYVPPISMPRKTSFSWSAPSLCTNL